MICCRFKVTFDSGKRSATPVSQLLRRELDGDRYQQRHVRDTDTGLRRSTVGWKSLAALLVDVMLDCWYRSQDVVTKLHVVYVCFLFHYLTIGQH